ncbi:hypothetical protein SFRURICE_005003, partial [Spodoptera frugiperda]
MDKERAAKLNFHCSILSIFFIEGRQSTYFFSRMGEARRSTYAIFGGLSKCVVKSACEGNLIWICMALWPQH